MIKGKIGIAITERNRYNDFLKSCNEIIKFAPKGAMIVVVDDESDIPFKEATFRFEHNVGIARSKNKCIELLEDCEHIFLFDSDCYPKVKDWHLPYINSGHKHLMYLFQDFSTGDKLNDSVLEYQDDKIKAYTHPRGCMLYLHNDCIKKAGGMRPEFGLWGVEHLNLSERIHNLGLTKFKFMDIIGSENLIHSMDEHRQVVTTVAGKLRTAELKQSLEIYEKLKIDTDFVPYKSNNIVLTCYFTTLIDPQRGHKWEYDPEILDTLINSVPEGVDFRCLSDHRPFSKLPMVNYTPKHDNPYLAKWIGFKDYIIAHPQYENIAMLDGSDCEIMVNPFDYIDKGKLYVGDEPGFTNNQWLIYHHNIKLMNSLLRMGRLPLLNAGVLIGHRDIVLEFIDHMVYLINTDQNVLTDMLYLNYILRRHFSDRLVHGRKVTTVFKAFDSANKNKSFIKHK